MDFHTFLRTVPKTELHVHYTGAVHAATLVDLANKYGVELPPHEQPVDLYDRSKFESILPKLKLVCQVLRAPDDFRRAVYETMKEAAENGVRYREIFWNPTDHWSISQVSYETAVDGMIAGLREAETDFGIVGRLIPSIDRESSSELGYEMVEQVVANPRDEVIGIGMDYLETNHPPEKFWKAYRLAGANGLKRTAHAGEFGEHYRNVETSLDLLGCDRIDHGYTIVDSPELQRRCLDDDVIFTVVPTNTYYSRTMRGMDFSVHHPIRKMADLGLRIFPNSDDPPMHHTDPGKAYIDMVEIYGFGLDDCRQFIVNSIDSAWVDESTKRQWREEWLADFDRLREDVTDAPPT